MKNMKILIADDHSVVRLGLAALFKYQRGFTVVGEAADGAEAIDRCRALRPDVVVMDLMMPGTDGVEATRRIRQDCPDTRVLILTTYGTSADVGRALEAGATGAMMKDCSNEELLDAIRGVADGKTVIAADIQRELRADHASKPLTPRQMDVLALVVKGLSNPDIARQFGISADAVKQHVSAICEKLGAANRAEAIAIALRKQLMKM